MKRTALLILSSALATTIPALGEPPTTRPGSAEPGARDMHAEVLRAQEQQETDARAKMRVEVVLADCREQFSKSKAAYEESVQTVAKLKEAVRAESRLADPSGLNVLMRDLQMQRETLLQEEAAAKGRRAGLEDAMARVDQQAAKRVDSDSVVKELQAVVKARQVKANRLKALRDAATVSQGEVDEADGELALARANAAAAQQRLTNGIAESADLWNREMMNLNIAGEERETRMQYIDKRLGELEIALRDQDRERDAENLLSHRSQELFTTQRNLAAVSPHDPLLQDSSK